MHSVIIQKFTQTHFKILKLNTSPKTLQMALPQGGSSVRGVCRQPKSPGDSW